MIQINLRSAWLVTFLLFLCQIINFFDKSVIGLAALPIMNDLQLSKSQFGSVASSFYSLYALSGVLVGLFVVRHIRAKWLLTFIVLVWSVAQIPMGLSSSLTVLVASRVVLGIGEGPAAASSINACYGWFASEKRNIPTSIIMLGSSVGTLISAPLLTHFILRYGWRSAFYVCSALGFCWLILWMLLGADGPLAVNSHAGPGAPAQPSPKGGAHAAFWSDKTVLTMILIGFCSYWSVGLVVAWLPSYLQSALGYDPAAASWLLAAISAVQIALPFALAVVSQMLLARGRSSRLARGSVNSLALAVGGICVAGAVAVTVSAFPSASSRGLGLVLLAIGLSLPMVTYSIGPAMIAEIAPPGERGRALLIIFSGITLAGLFAPMATGYIIERAPTPSIGFGRALLVDAFLLFLGGAVGLWGLNPERSRLRLAAGSTPLPAAA